MLKHLARSQVAVLLMVGLGSFAFSALVRAALADHYHTNCVGHGFVHGSDTNDGSFFSRVETGCGSTYRKCAIYSNFTWRGEEIAPDSGTTCNAWSNDFGSYTECASYAKVYNQGVFSEHNHLAHNWCS
ncbi:MAG TPA: hypothetical protein VF529_13215 [Solirubrobacteraceae bacterium]|jgi:hypothetical protein